MVDAAFVDRTSGRLRDQSQIAEEAGVWTCVHLPPEASDYQRSLTHIPGRALLDWTSRELHTRVVARHPLTHHDYRLTQLRYDLTKLRAKGLVERIGKTRRYCLTPIGLKLGVLLVKLRTRLLGPLVSPDPSPEHQPGFATLPLR